MRALLVGTLLGCSSSPGGNPGEIVGPWPDFALVDVNATSPRAGEAVSPRDYLGEVSAWYFGHAT